jgi:hypothetical protein
MGVGKMSYNLILKAHEVAEDSDGFIFKVRTKTGTVYEGAPHEFSPDFLLLLPGKVIATDAIESIEVVEV